MVASADPQEMAKFEQLADTWWDTSGPFWPLHKLNTIRTGYIREVVAEHLGQRSAAADAPLAGVRMLDIGCGGGLLSEAMARLGAEVHGVDVVERNVRIAERHRPPELASHLTYEHGSVEALAQRGERYDVVLNMEVVEHVVDLPAFIAECCRLVKADGLMFVSTINRNPLSFVSAIVGAEYILRWLPRGTHDWRKFPTPAELTSMLTDNAMQVTRRKGVRVNPLTRKFSLTDSLAINYMLVTRVASTSA